MTAYPKTKPHRDEKYRRLVALMPCFSCGIEGYSQVAHSNLGKHGKGGAMKASDYATFPLCCARPGVMGCHAQFDQGVIVTKLNKEALTDFFIQSAQKRAKAAGFVFPEGACYE